MIISVEKIKFQCQGAVQRPKHARVGVRARTQGDLMVGEGVLTRPKCFGVIIFWCYFVSKTLQSWDKRVFRRCWVKMTERVKWKSSQILQFRAHFCRNCKFLFSHIWRGPGGIFWPKTLSDTHLEHPKKVPFLTERGRKRVKEWRYTTFMKEWMKALNKTRILSPTELKLLFLRDQILHSNI